MHVVTPHEFFMALLPDQFPWESRVITDFSSLLPKLQTSKAAVKEVEEEKSQAKPDETALMLM